jgi:hypothetical protein
MLPELQDRKESSYITKRNRGDPALQRRWMPLYPELQRRWMIVMCLM